MQHSMVLKEETATDVLFECSNCGTLLGFNKPGIGEPVPVQTEGGWAPPEGFESYIGPCKEDEAQA